MKTRVADSFQNRIDFPLDRAVERFPATPPTKKPERATLKKIPG